VQTIGDGAKEKNDDHHDGEGNASTSTQAPLPNTLRIALPSSYVHTTHNLDSDPVFEFSDGCGLLPNDQEEIFGRVVRPAIEGAFSGYNSCIFAYGQTGSGKTYTMTGGASYKERGIIPRMLSYVFERAGPGVNIFISYLEIYNENAYDILDKSKGGKALESWGKVMIQEDGDGEAVMSNLRVFECVSEEQALSLLFLGNSNRITSATKMNNASSRSHAIFTLSVRNSSSDEKVSTGKIHIVDLAGSERHSKAHLDLVDSFVLNDSFADNALDSSVSYGMSGRGGNKMLTKNEKVEKDGTRINLSLHFLQVSVASDETKTCKRVWFQIRHPGQLL